MKGVRFRKAELEVLRWALAYPEASNPEPPPKHYEQTRSSILDKLVAATEKVVAGGPSAQSLEDSLVRNSRNKVVRTTPGGYSRVYRQALSNAATVEQMAEVGEWLARQKWLTEPVTIVGVLNKWADWYPKAHASAAPTGLPEGLSGEKGDVRPGAQAPGRQTSGGRAPSGFR